MGVIMKIMHGKDASMLLVLQIHAKQLMRSQDTL